MKLTQAKAYQWNKKTSEELILPRFDLYSSLTSQFSETSQQSLNGYFIAIAHIG
jgi:hypothetical protein